jgi:hypothetical protein
VASGDESAETKRRQRNLKEKADDVKDKVKSAVKG